MANDTVNVQRGIVGAGSDDDTYVLSASLIDDNAEITISDVEGANKIQLIGGLSITSSIVAGDTAQLTLSNGAVVTVLGASTMSYEVGGNPLTGTAGVTKDYATFAQDVLGTTVPTTGTSTGGESVVNEDGTATGGTPVDPTAPTYALAAGAESVDEGATATFTLTTTNVAEGTEVAYTISGVDAADVTGGSLTGTATVGADGTATISVALASDTTTEGAETLTVAIDGQSASATTTVNDTSLNATFTLATTTTTVTEGAAAIYTVTASEAVAVDTVVTFEVVPGDATAADQGTNNTNLNDFAAGSFNPVSVTIAAGSTTASFDVAAANDGKTELPENYTVNATVNGETLSVVTSLLDGTSTTTEALTTSVDTITSSTGALVANGVIATDSGTGTTAQAGDSVTGGSSTQDTVNIQVSGTHTANQTLSAFQTTDVEIFNVSNFQTGAFTQTVDASLMNGLTTVGLTSSSANGDTAFSNLKNIVSATMASGNADLTLGYGSTVVSGTADTQTLAVSNVTGGTFTANSIETVSVTSSLAASTLTAVSADAMTQLNLAGDQNITITNALDFAGTSTIAGTVDGSTATGKLTLNLSTVEDTNVTGGSGDDTFDYGTALTTKDVLNGGAGTDTISVNQDTFTLATYTNVSNVEVIKAEATNGNGLSVVTGGNAAITKVQLVENDTDNQAITASDLAAGAEVELISNTAGATDNMGAVTLGLNDSSGTEDALTVTLKGTTAHTAASNTVASLTVSNVETVNLVSSYDGTVALTAADDNTVGSLVIGETKTLNITGTEEIGATVAANTVLTTADASAMTKDVTLDVSAVTTTTGLTVKTGSGNDVITFGTALDATDTVDAGANTGTGEDTLTATVTGWTTTTGKPAIANVEQINLLNNGTATIDGTNITGTSSINLDASSDVTTLSNLSTTTSVGLGFKDESTASTALGTVTVGLADETGTADALTVNVFHNATATLKATAIETVNLAYSDTDTTITNTTALTVSALNAATVNVTGAKADTDHTLGLGTLDTDTDTLNASGYYGILTAVAGTANATAFSAMSGNAHSLTGSTANDTFTVTGGSSNAAYTINGAGGTDALTLDVANGALDLDGVTDIDTVTLNVANSAVVTTNADGDVLDGINEATSVVITGGNSLSSLTLGGGTDTLVAGTINTKIDASTFNGFINNATFTLDQFDANEAGVTTQLIGGATSKDKVTASYDADNDASVAINMQAVETFDISLGDSNTELVMDMSLVTGLSTINVTDASNESIEFDKLATGVTVDVTSQNGTGNTTVEVKQADVSGSSDSQTFIVAATNADDNVALVMADVETINLSSDTANQADLDLSGISMTTAGKTNTLNITGSNDIEITALNADVTTIDASGMSAGGVIISASSVTAASTITGSLADDTFIMAHKDDAINAGDGADTLTINYTSVIGGMSIDLSSTSDQIATFNGASNSAVQTGFQHVNLSGYTGNGAEVTANASGSTITGTNSTDQITGGAGNDTITAGGGVDTILLTSGGNDVVTLTTGTDANNYDQITGFATTTDDIKALDTDFTWFNGTSDGVVALATGANMDAVHAANNNATVATISTNVATHTFTTFLAGTSTYAQLEGAVATAMGTATDANFANTDKILVAIDDGAHTGLFYWQSAGDNNAAEAAELEMIGILNGVTDATTLVAGDFLFA